MLSTEYIVVYIYIYICMYLNEIYFCPNYDLIYMILDNLTMFLTLIHRIFISIVLLISSKKLLQIYFNTEYLIFIYNLE